MFTSRWNNYKDNSTTFDKGEDCMQKKPLRTFPSTRSYWFFARLITPTLGHPLSMKITGFIGLMGINVEAGY